MTGMAILRIARLRKSFGATEVLKGIDLTVSERELVFIIGPSGSGKSTLLRCCNRLEEPTSGAITFDGVDLMARSTASAWPPRRSPIRPNSPAASSSASPSPARSRWSRP